MQLLSETSAFTVRLLPLLGTIAFVVGGLVLVNWLLKRRWRDNPDAQFRFQLIMLALTFAGFLAIIVALPISDGTRGQLLSLIGILLSAAIALSSTTFIGNMMAGIMLKAVRSARPGDFITVADLTGRITEMGLLHTEVQTEFRDLVTVPNLYMVTQPLQVVRASGTIITAEVSLGYDVSHVQIAQVLVAASAGAGLTDGFVQIRQLGDFAVTYRVAGLLEDVKSLISARSKLREAVLDALHAAGIEIVSPNFMNTRAVADGKLFIPETTHGEKREATTKAEDIAFDKAEEAASVDEIRKSIELIDAEITALSESDGTARDTLQEELESRKQGFVAQLKAAEERLKTAELAERSGVETNSR